MKAKIALFTLADFKAAEGGEPRDANTQYRFRGEGSKSTFAFGNSQIDTQTKERVENGRKYSITAIVDRERAKLLRIVFYVKEGPLTLEDQLNGSVGEEFLTLKGGGSGDPQLLNFQEVVFKERTKSTSFIWDLNVSGQIIGYTWKPKS